MAGISNHLRAMGEDIRPGQRVSEVLTASRLNGILGAIRGIARGENIRSGRGILLRQTGDGVVLTSTANGRGASGGPSPFDITINGTTATFRAGTINGLLPSNYLTGVSVTLTGTRYLVLNCTANNGEITAASFAEEASAPAAIAPYQGQPPVAFKILIGVLVDGVPTKIWGDGNIQALGSESFRLSRVAPTAGELPYDVFYTWALSLL